MWKDLWVTLKSQDSSTCISNADDSDDSRLSPVPEAVGIQAVQLRKNIEVKGLEKQLGAWVGAAQAFSPVLDKLDLSHIKSFSAMHI